MTAAQINKESEKNPNEISTNSSQDLEDETSINGKKSTKKHKGGTTYKRQHLSRYGKKTCEFLNQVGVTKVDISFKKKSQSLATKKKNFKAKIKFAASKTFTRMQSWTTAKVGQYHKLLPSLTISSRDIVDTPEKKEVGFVRQTSEQETICLDGASSSLTNSSECSRLWDGKT